MIIVLGVGNEMKGDDGVGPYVAKKVKQTDQLVAIDTSTAPENFFGKIEELKPDKLIVVDAIDFGGNPGETRVVDTAKLDRRAQSTHNMPIRLLIDILKISAVFVGIQIRQNVIGEGLSPEVKAAADALVKKLNSGAAIS
ncbi:MAG: hydrogenase 3 maturation endopeptidase HyCI [archaeon]